jgi:hypothetical protein
MKQSPIFSKTYDFVAWLIPLTLRFPRQQRFVLAHTLQREALRFQGLLIEAAHQSDPGERLIEADAELDKVRTHLRLCLDMGLVSPGQYAHGAQYLVEMGNLLGGWKKQRHPKGLPPDSRLTSGDSRVTPPS